MLIKPFLTSALETALNQYLSLDEDVGLFLQPLAGKVLAISITPFNDTLYLCPTYEKIQVLESYHGEVDTTLTGSLLAFGVMGLSNSPMQSIYQGEIEISGDMEVGQKFQRLFEKLDIDVEEKVSHYTGDVIAHKIGQFFRQSQQWTQQSIETFKLNAQEFLQEETQDLPSLPEAQFFYDEVDVLRMDYDRLEARLNSLQNQLNNKEA